MELLIALILMGWALQSSPILAAILVVVMLVFFVASEPYFLYTFGALYGFVWLIIGLGRLHGQFRRKFPCKQPPKELSKAGGLLIYVTLMVSIGLLSAVFWLDEGPLWNMMAGSFVVTCFGFLALSALAVWRAI
jgi:hypothetical protein